jgi:hypothetical protein
VIKPKVKFDVKTAPGFEKFMKEIGKKRWRPYVAVGLNEGAGEYEDGESVINVGLWNEFGTKDIPSRPWLRSVVYGKEDQINRIRANVVTQIASGKISMKKGLEILGERIVLLIQNQILGRGPFQANADSTIASKKRKNVSPPNRPLYDSGLLARSVTAKVYMR